MEPINLQPSTFLRLPSFFNSKTRRNPGLIIMLYFYHLRYQISRCDYLRMSISAGEHKFYLFWANPQQLQHSVDR